METLKIEQVARALQVKYGTAYKLVTSGSIKGFQLHGKGTSWRVQETELEKYIKEMEER